MDGKWRDKRDRDGAQPVDVGREVFAQGRHKPDNHAKPDAANHSKKIRRHLTANSVYSSDSVPNILRIAFGKPWKAMNATAIQTVDATTIILSVFFVRAMFPAP